MLVGHEIPERCLTARDAREVVVHAHTHEQSKHCDTQHFGSCSKGTTRAPLHLSGTRRTSLYVAAVTHQGEGEARRFEAACSKTAAYYDRRARKRGRGRR